MRNSGNPPPLHVLLSFALAFAAAATFSPAAASQRSPIRQLVKARVIPDVINLFVPRPSSRSSTALSGSSTASSSLPLPPPRPPPSGSTPGIVADPDAPSPSNSTLREILHWLVVNIPRGNVTRGEELVPYVGPAPPIGVHRYVFSLFRQKKPLKGVKVPTGRALFRTRRFAADNRLGLPVAALYFNSTKETTA
ncbi:unnamed protein product [Spirodela intermedia]|uniref:Uncharacterized protein n=1 Tax=Spirodela intermedia TaxID=51605 RepID=A0A7I8IKK2_SPIIN|nr:unnamed protein product [Spirodela intermedia]CAA6658400.1 unnamed protein product [Spirodela intermedia]